MEFTFNRVILPFKSSDEIVYTENYNDEKLLITYFNNYKVKINKNGSESENFLNEDDANYLRFLIEKNEKCTEEFAKALEESNRFGEELDRCRTYY